MADVQDLAGTVAWCGFGLGIVFGFVAQRTGFCAMGAVSDVVIMGDWGRMRAWLLAIAIAILGTGVLAATGILDVAKTIYTPSSFTWLAYGIGGLCFGVGMTLASGCGNKTLVRAGAGNLKSVVVFVFLAYSAFVTLKGVFGAFRVEILQAPAVTIDLPTLQTLPHLLHRALGLELATAQLMLAIVISGALFAFVFLNKAFRQSKDNVIGGAVVGAVVVAGWYVTGKIGLAENPETLEEMVFGTNTRLAESMTFIAPSAYTLEYWAYWTDTRTVVTFGIAAVFGVTIGSFLCAVASKSFRWEHFVSTPDMLRHMAGGILMGFGGVTALGCTIGQGITGLSTLSLGSLIVFVSIVAGATATMKFEYWRLTRVSSAPDQPG